MDSFSQNYSKKRITPLHSLGEYIYTNSLYKKEKGMSDE